MLETNLVTPTQFESAYLCGKDLTFRFLVSRGAPTESAEECAQAAWVRGWERRRQLKRLDAIVPWVNSIALNMLRSSIALSRKHIPLDLETPCASSANLAHLDVEALMNKCRECDRCLIRKYYLEERSTEEIARELRIKKTTVRVRLLRVRRWLRTVMAATAEPAKPPRQMQTELAA